MGLGKTVPNSEPRLVYCALVVLQCLIINVAAVTTSQPGVHKEDDETRAFPGAHEDWSVVSSLVQQRLLLRSSRGVYEASSEGAPTHASEVAAAAAVGGLGMIPSPPIVDNFMRDTELLESELRRVRAERKSDEEGEKNSVARSRMVAASGMVLHAATKLRNRVLVVHSSGQAKSLPDLHKWYWKDLIIPTGAYLVCVLVILTLFFVIVSSIPSPKRLLQKGKEKKRGCCSTFWRTMYNIHWRTRITLLCILGIGWGLFIAMWWAHIIQPWVKQFVMIVFALMIVVSLILLLVMELTEICKQHGRKALQKVERMEKYLEEMLQAGKEARKTLQFWRHDDSDSESDDDQSDSEEAARPQREEAETPRRQRPRPCC